MRSKHLYNHPYTHMWMGFTPDDWGLIQSALAQYAVRYKNHARDAETKEGKKSFQRIARRATRLIKEIA